MEYLCIKSCKMTNGKHKGKYAFTKGKKYHDQGITEDAVFFIDNMGQDYSASGAYLDERFKAI